uniref:Thaumatin-like protein 13 n=1 Tax=Moniliophthora perniciosa TaxID=153609 RepID=A0A0K2FH67_MONPR|nr:thaumatin-like protein 13 [Moniliophthora perniciosa]
MMWTLLLVLAAANSRGLAARTFTVTNNCAYTIWPAIWTDPNVSKTKLDHPGGWEAASGTSVSFSVPDDWGPGRIWGRRECDFGSSQNGTCISGGCDALECTNVGQPPTTVAEFALSTAGGNTDYYDVSLVDGFNLPLQVTNNAKCQVASCPVDLNASCPPQLRGTPAKDGSNSVCKSSCLANLDGKQIDSPNCCSGTSNTPDSCTPAGVQFYDFFKGRCPSVYSYAYDEQSGSALMSCDSTLSASYTITFCP